MHLPVRPLRSENPSFPEQSASDDIGGFAPSDLSGLGTVAESEAKVRAKIYLLTLGLVSGSWIAGCESRPLRSTSSTQVASAKPAGADPHWATQPPIVKLGPAPTPSVSPSAIANPQRALVTEETPYSPGAVQGRPAVRSGPVLPGMPIDPAPGPRFDNLPAPAFPTGPEGLKPLGHEEIIILPGAASLQPAMDPGQVETFTIPAAPSRPEPRRSVPATTSNVATSTVHEERPAPQESAPVTAVAPAVAVAAEQPLETTSRPVPSRALESHRTLTGEVHQFRRGWRLRYAAVDADDPHGGSVVLEGVGVAHLRDGQTVRVVGTLIPAEDRNSAARFQVTMMEIER